MAAIYAQLIEKEVIGIDEVPEKHQAAVQAILASKNEA